MIYLDNAAGTFPKPERVMQAMQEAARRYGANPGRGSYALSRDTSAMVERVRGQLAELLHAPDPQRIVFTAGATASLNTAVFGLLRPGDEVVTTAMEHHALWRPLEELARAGRIRLQTVAADAFGYIEAEQVERRIGPRTRLLAIGHASNVCGSVQPLDDLLEIAARRQTPLLLDAAQSAGLLPLDVRHPGLALVALPAHKALYGPPGVGALYVREDIRLQPLLFGGTGVFSEAVGMTRQMPQRLEAGSLNTVGIAGWGAALQFVQEIGLPRLYRHALRLTQRLYRALVDCRGIRLYADPTRPRVPVLALTAAGIEPAELAAALDRHGVAVRSGYHCAYQAHLSLGTANGGALRFSPGWFNREAEIDAAAAALRQTLGL